MIDTNLPVRTRVHHRVDAVDAASWDRLCAAMERPTYFNSYAWAEAWEQHLAAGRATRILAAYRGDALVGLLPLALTPQRRLLFERTLLAPLGGLSMSAAQYLGPICAHEHEAAVLDALVRAMDQLDGYDALYLENYLAGSATERLAGRMERAGRGRFMRWAGETTHRRALAPTYDAFVKTLPKKKRQNLRTSRNKLARHPEIAFRRVRGAEELDLAVACFRRHSVTRLEEKGVTSTLTDSDMTRFFRTIVHRAAVDGHGETFAAYDGDTIIGTLFALHFGRWICYYNGSFDVAYSNLSVGRLLVDELVRYAIDHGFEELDLLAGSGDYKQRWVPGSGERLLYASLVTSPVASLPFTLWDAWKASRGPWVPADGSPAGVTPDRHPLLRVMRTARGQVERLATLMRR